MLQNLLGTKGLSMGLLALTGALTAGSAGTGMYSLALRMKVNRALADADPVAAVASANSAAEGKIKDARAKDHESLVALVKEKNLFGVENNLVFLQAIVGESALINGKWMNLGQEENGVRLVELQSNRAIVQVNGEQRDVQLWASMPGLDPNAQPAQSAYGKVKMKSDKGRIMRSAVRIDSSHGDSSGALDLGAANEEREKRKNARKEEIRQKREEMKQLRQSSLGQ